MKAATADMDGARSGIVVGLLRGLRRVRYSLGLVREHGPVLLMCLLVHRVTRTWMSLLNRVSLPGFRQGYVLREILGSRMYLDLADEGVSRELLVDGVREEANVEVFRRELRRGSVVVDIGANIGYYVLFESRLVGDEGKVYGIEPVPANSELLRKNVEANGYSNTELFQFAIGDAPGVHALQLSRHRNRPTFRDITGTTKTYWATGTIDVDVMPLDDFLKDKRYPDAIRMDVEGYEYHIIKGMADTLKVRHPLTLFIEFHFHLMTRAESTEILETLRSAGFGIVDVSPAGGIQGRHRHRLLSKAMRLVEPVIERKLGRIPPGRRYHLSIDDILADPALLDGERRALHICFRRD